MPVVCAGPPSGCELAAAAGRWGAPGPISRDSSVCVCDFYISLQVKDLILLEMVIQNQYLRRQKTRFYRIRLDLQGFFLCRR